MSCVTDPRDPVRLSDDGSQLASAIIELRSEHGSREQVQALSQRLSAKLGTAALCPTHRPVPSANRYAPLAGATLAILGVWLGLSQPSRQHIAVNSAQSTARATVIESPALPVLPDVPKPSLEAPPPTAAVNVCTNLDTPSAPGCVAKPVPVAPHVVRRRHPLPREEATEQPIATPLPTKPDPEGELDLLRRAQAALRHQDSRSALEFVGVHAREYPHGVFVQEREVIAVAALLKRQRRPEALARARQFIARFGDSPYAFRLRSMLEQSPRTGSHETAGATPAS